MGKQLFINPYNFVPFGSTVEEKRKSREEQYRGESALVSGWLTVDLYTKTPLIIPDGAHPQYWDPEKRKYIQNPSDEQKKRLHKEYAFMRIPGKEGKQFEQPVIPGSELRGMIRSVYETATDSCVAFLLNDKPISQRVPVFGSLRRRGLLAYEQISSDSEQRHWVLYSAYTELIAVSVDKNGNMKYENGQLVKEKNGDYIEGHGWLQYNIPVNKEDLYHIAYLEKKELIYSWDFECDGEPDREKNEEPYRALKSTLDRDGASGRNANETPNRNLAEALERAKKGEDNMVPVYFFTVQRGKETLIYLSNSSIGRIAQRRKWKEIMGMHAPCEDTDKLCPACLLFGTTKRKGLKGHIRVSDAIPDGQLQPEIHTLQILGKPRSTAFEFYLRKPEGVKAIYWNFDFYGEKVEDSEENVHTEYHDLEKSALRGRKMYWHSPIAPDTSKNKMNSTMEAMSGSFEFRVYFDEITEGQLQDLIWVITLGENQQDSTRLHKLGHAKPLGYGSVKLIVTEKVIRRIKIRNDSIEVEKETSRVDPVVELNPNLESTLDLDSEMIKNLLIMCDTKSIPANTPVMYPKYRGLIYLWFANNRKNSEYLHTLPEPTDKNLTLVGSWRENSEEVMKEKRSQSAGQKINHTLQEAKRDSGNHNMSRIKGKVKFFKIEQNYGYIIGEDGNDYKVSINPKYNPGLEPDDLKKDKMVSFVKKNLNGKWVANQCEVL